MVREVFKQQTKLIKLSLDRSGQVLQNNPLVSTVLLSWLGLEGHWSPSPLGEGFWLPWPRSICQRHPALPASHKVENLRYDITLSDGAQLRSARVNRRIFHGPIYGGVVSRVPGDTWFVRRCTDLKSCLQMVWYQLQLQVPQSAHDRYKCPI